MLTAAHVQQPSDPSEAPSEPKPWLGTKLCQLLTVQSSFESLTANVKAGRLGGAGQEGDGNFSCAPARAALKSQPAVLTKAV